MISDYQILGIEQTDDISLVKKAYRLRAKQLHPDTADDGTMIGNHFLFVEVCKAYQRLTASVAQCGGAKNAPDSRGLARGNPDKPAPNGAGRLHEVVAHSDPAYAYYKKGMDIFRRIHPSEWKESEKSVIQTEIGDTEEGQKKARARVVELVSMLPKAYFLFSTVVNEYPLSVWASDSGEKMRIIEERMILYKKIIGSFASRKDSRDGTR